MGLARIELQHLLVLRYRLVLLIVSEERVRLVQSQPRAQGGRGSAYLRAGSVEEAEKAYREALKLRPKYGEAHNNLAVICIKRGDYEEAHSHVKAAQKAGFKVHPQLVADIEAARRAGGK